MATIDLRHAILTIRDGSTTGSLAGATGAVNNGAGYITGDVTMVVDGFTGVMASGRTFTVAGETGTPTHTITAHTETGGNTTNITFTPALAGAVADNAVITVAAVTGSPNSLEVKIGEGNFTYTEKRDIQYRRNRGLLYTVRYGDEQPVEANFDFQWEFLRSNTGEPVTIEEALKKVGAAATWTTSSADPCEPYAVDLVLTYVPPCAGELNEIIVLQDFRWESLDHNLKDGQVSVKGQCNVTEAQITRTTTVGNLQDISDLPSEEAPKADSIITKMEQVQQLSAQAARERVNPRAKELQEGKVPEGQTTSTTGPVAAMTT